MMLIVNMVQGSFMATIAEGLTLAQVTGQSQQTLLDILNQGQLASIFLDQKCQSRSAPVCFFLLAAKGGSGSWHRAHSSGLFAHTHSVCRYRPRTSLSGVYAGVLDPEP